MYKMLIYSCLVFISVFSYGQNNTMNLPSNLGKTMILKTNPTLLASSGNLQYRGWHLGYEISSGLPFLSLMLSTKYAFIKEGIDSKKRFVKFELQSRIWTTQLMRNFFVAPTFSYYTTNHIAWGGLFGFQHITRFRFTMETWVGLQKTTPIENFNSDYFIRLGLNFGWLAKAKIKTESL